MRKLLDLENPFFAPLWIRILIVLITAGWGLFELAADAPLWGIIFLGLSIICAWRFATIDYTNDSQE